MEFHGLGMRLGPEEEHPSSLSNTKNMSVIRSLSALRSCDSDSNPGIRPFLEAMSP